MDPLQPLPIDQWHLLRDIFKRDWPIYAQYFYWVNNAIKWKKKDPQYLLTIYCPYKQYDSGVFVGISTETLRITVIAGLEESQGLLQKALTDTEVIDWSQPTLFAAVHQYCKDTLLNAVKELQKSKNIHITRADVTNYHFKPKEECVKLSIEVSEEYELKHLDSSHIPLVHSVWPHRSKDHPELSTRYLEKFVTRNRGIGLFLKKDNSLVSWVLHTDWGGLGMLQTLEEHKRKGYGKIVVKAMIKELAEEENLDSILFVIENNVPSEKFFMSLGYKRFTTATWIMVEPIVK